MIQDGTPEFNAQQDELVRQQRGAQAPSPTAGMNIAQRILHVGGRNNAAGYVEFGSIQAVEALVRQVLRDQPADSRAAQAGVPAGWLPVHSNGRGFYGGPLKTEDEAKRYIDQVHQSNDSVTLVARPFVWSDAAVPQSLPWPWTNAAEVLNDAISHIDGQERLKDALRLLAAAPQPSPSPATAGIYVASRASVPERPARWRALRDAGWPIVSTWIDEAGPGETDDLGELWGRITREVTSAQGVLLHVEPEDFPLKGALIEVGMALSLGKRVGIYAPGVALEERSLRPLGSWAAHPLVRIAPTLQGARDWVESASPAPAQPGQEGEPAGRFMDEADERKSAKEGYEKRIKRVSERNPNDEGMYTLGWWDRAWKAAARAAPQPATVDELRTAAQAVVDRWDTPLWKDVPATAEYIGRLRAALTSQQGVKQ